MQKQFELVVWNAKIVKQIKIQKNSHKQTGQYAKMKLSLLNLIKYINNLNSFKTGYFIFQLCVLGASM